MKDIIFRDLVFDTFLLKYFRYIFLKVSLCGIFILTYLGSLSQSLLTNSATIVQMQKEFTTPPEWAHPWVYWFWLNSNLTREGITADLEAMKRVGIGGVLIMDVNQGTPPGPMPFMDEKWQEMFGFAVQEAKRLGLEINMNNDAGWNGSGGPWITPEYAMQTLTFSETRVDGGKMTDIVLTQPPSKGDYYRDVAVLAVRDSGLQTPQQIMNLQEKALFSLGWYGNEGVNGGFDTEAPGRVILPGDGVIDISHYMNTQGLLQWKVPEGNWTVLRYGHTWTGSVNRPSALGGEGPDCDKLSRDGIRKHFDGLLKQLLELAGKEAGKTLSTFHIDSWEVGAQNWTSNMREEFKKRRGYDLIPYLPVFSGRIIGSPQQTERFLWDVRQTVSELMVQNYVGEMQQLCHRYGMKFSMESYTTIGNDLDAANHVDEPIAEFWTPYAWKSVDSLNHTMKAMASAAHINGQQVVAAESFTSDDSEKWLLHPARIKALGDSAFCNGINKFIFHRYAMQPWQNQKPGMSMGPWGLHYERTQTWWNYLLPWHTYLARCQYLLRQGDLVADVLNLQPEEPNYRFRTMDITGYDYNACSPDAFKKVTVKNGLLTDGAGNRYRLLVLTHLGTMTEEQLRQIRDLVVQGACILGEPPVATPGLTDYPAADDRLKQFAEELWGKAAVPVQDRQVGRGRVFRGISPEEALKRMSIVFDFSSDKKLKYIHRSVGNTDIYFVASGADSIVVANCSFRVKGKQPQWWDPETGRMNPMTAYASEGNGTIKVPLVLDPIGSGFVVFIPEDHPDPERVIQIARNGEVLYRGGVASFETGKGHTSRDMIDLTKREITLPGDYEFTLADGKVRRIAILPQQKAITIAGQWKLKFPEGSRAPAEVKLGKLESWTEYDNKEVNYYSGTAKYFNTFTLPEGLPQKGERLYLDLGKVAVMAKVFVNGKEAGICWKPPYRTDITSLVQQGENHLQIDVVNLWINRMIGDEHLGEDSERNEDGALKSWPGWVMKDQESPAGRCTFTTWRLWKKDDPLQESGLLGPVWIYSLKTFE